MLTLRIETEQRDDAEIRFGTIDVTLVKERTYRFDRADYGHMPELRFRGRILWT